MVWIHECGSCTLELRSTVPAEWPWGPRRLSFPVEKEVSPKSNQDGLMEGKWGQGGSYRPG